MTETLDFIDVMVPVLEAGTWTNYGETPKIVTKQKSGPSKRSSRGNKNARVEVKNEDGPADDDDLTFNGVIIQDNLSGQVTLVETDKSSRNKMKTDLMEIIRLSGIPFSKPRIANNPAKRNKDKTTYFLQIIN